MVTLSPTKCKSRKTRVSVASAVELCVRSCSEMRLDTHDGSLLISPSSFKVSPFLLSLSLFLSSRFFWFVCLWLYIWRENERKFDWFLVLLSLFNYLCGSYSCRSVCGHPLECVCVAQHPHSILLICERVSFFYFFTFCFLSVE